MLLNAKANSARLTVNIRRLIVGPEARSLERPRLLKASAKARIVKTSVKAKKQAAAVKASKRTSREMQDK